MERSVGIGQRDFIGNNQLSILRLCLYLKRFHLYSYNKIPNLLTNSINGFDCFYSLVDDLSGGPNSPSFKHIYEYRLLFSIFHLYTSVNRQTDLGPTPNWPVLGHRLMCYFRSIWCRSSRCDWGILAWLRIHYYTSALCHSWLFTIHNNLLKRSYLSLNHNVQCSFFLNLQTF